MSSHHCDRRWSHGARRFPGASAHSITLPTLLDVTSPAAAFKRVVRDLEFDVGELAIVTFLLANVAEFRDPPDYVYRQRLIPRRFTVDK